MRANTAVLASFYATCTSPAAYSTAAAALVASSPPSPGAGRAQKEGNPTPFLNYEQADGVELKARQGARDAGSVLVRNKSSASTCSGGSQPWSPAFAAAEFCFTSSSRWLHAQPSTINLRPAARQLIFESAQLPAATEALPATECCLNSSIRNIVDGIELRLQQQGYNEDSTADTPPSTINLRPAARRLIFESAQLPAATEALLATDPCVNSSIRNIVDGIELRLQQQRYNKDSAADTPPSTVSLRLATRRLIFEFAQLPAAAEAPPAADPCLGSSIKNMIGGMVERVHQLRCKASTLDTLPSTVSLLPAARRLIFESAQLPAAAEAVLQKTTAHEPQPLCLCRDWSLAPVASSAVVKGSAWQPATRVEGFSIGAGDAQPQHIPASVAAVTAQQQPVKAFDMWSAPWLGSNISSRAISGSDAQWQLSTAPTSSAAVTAQQHPVKVFDMWSGPSFAISNAERQPIAAPICSGDGTAQQHPVKVFDMWSGPSFAISNAEHQPIAAPICSGDGTAAQQLLGAFNMWSSVWIGSSIVQVCA
ncbi:hypothetical protein D9Q98_009240 [Chlorella vulgaris]|uniref:Uncharacterized protein n=1 Tax=Chlorella vulgaris TaxID=3077 RepID=A0A9D4YXM7_CHLVU|nr:hypothetical protein D9Q98_009240 [Chlorella vulgaris]